MERLLQKRLRCSKLHLCQRRLLLLPRSVALAVACAAAAVEAVQVSCIRAACLLLLLLLLLPPHMFRQTAEWLACLGDLHDVLATGTVRCCCGGLTRSQTNAGWTANRCSESALN